MNIIHDRPYDMPPVLRGDLIVQETYPADEKPWYVHEVSLLDMGRFRTRKEAKEHALFLLNKQNENN